MFSPGPEIEKEGAEDYIFQNLRPLHPDFCTCLLTETVSASCIVPLGRPSSQVNDKMTFRTTLLFTAVVERWFDFFSPPPPSERRWQERRQGAGHCIVSCCLRLELASSVSNIIVTLAH